MAQVSPLLIPGFIPPQPSRSEHLRFYLSECLINPSPLSPVRSLTPQCCGSFWNVLPFFHVPQDEAQKSPSGFPRQATLLCPWGLDTDLARSTLSCQGSLSEFLSLEPDQPIPTSTIFSMRSREGLAHLGERPMGAPSPADRSLIGSRL